MTPDDRGLQNLELLQELAQLMGDLMVELMIEISVNFSKLLKKDFTL